MKNEISKKLLDLKFDASCKGFFLLVEAIVMKKTNTLLNLGEICHSLAKETQTSPAAVDKNIRTCIRKSDNQYKEMTVNEVINRIVVEL